jgi:hypothetical protein
MPDSQGPDSVAASDQGGLGSPAPSNAGPEVGATPGTQHPGPKVTAWADELSGRVIDGVGWLKARTTVPIVKVLRAIVYGLVVLVAAVTALVLAVLGVVRMWDAYVPVHPLGRRVWLGYVVLGSLLFLAGGALLARRATSKGKS